MLIVRMKSLNADREKREKMREEIREQTQQEVIVLPCECELVKVTDEKTTEETEIKATTEGINAKVLKEFLEALEQHGGELQKISVETVNVETLRRNKVKEISLINGKLKIWS